MSICSTLEGVWWSGGKIIRCFNFEISWEKQSSVSILYDTCWVPQPVYTQWRKWTIPVPAGGQTSIVWPVSNHVTDRDILSPSEDLKYPTRLRPQAIASSRNKMNPPPLQKKPMPNFVLTVSKCHYYQWFQTCGALCRMNLDLIKSCLHILTQTETDLAPIHSNVTSLEMWSYASRCSICVCLFI
jgi:hypothetical protein